MANRLEASSRILDAAPLARSESVCQNFSTSKGAASSVLPPPQRPIIHELFASDYASDKSGIEKSRLPVDENGERYRTLKGDASFAGTAPIQDGAGMKHFRNAMAVMATGYRGPSRVGEAVRLGYVRWRVFVPQWGRKFKSIRTLKEIQRWFFVLGADRVIVEYRRELVAG